MPVRTSIEKDLRKKMNSVELVNGDLSEFSLSRTPISVLGPLQSRPIPRRDSDTFRVPFPDDT